MSQKRKALGRGLGSLIPATKKDPSPRPVTETPASSVPQAHATAAASRGLRTLPIEQLSPGPDQPRKHFDPEQLTQLAESIKTQGIIQPIVVTQNGAPPGTYFIVAGERRWRAAQQAGLHDVPVVVRDADEHQRLELALVENIQRADLNPVEEARAFEHLMALSDYGHEELAARLGKDRSTISNTLRLLRLPQKVQEMLRMGEISTGHARAILGLPAEAERIDLAREVARDNLSVRATERAVRRRLAEAAPKKPESDEASRRRIIVSELEDRLRQRLGVRVRLRGKRGSKNAGVIELPYNDLDELDRLLNRLLDSDAS